MVSRWLAAAGVLVSALVHLQLWWQGFRVIDVVGPLFLVNAVAGVAITVAVLVWRHWLALLAAAGFAAATLTAFVLSTTVGFFGVHERWSGGPVITAAVAEVVALAAGLVGLARESGAGRLGR